MHFSVAQAPVSISQTTCNFPQRVVSVGSETDKVLRLAAEFVAEQDELAVALDRLAKVPVFLSEIRPTEGDSSAS
jgi:hypothetical protein